MATNSQWTKEQDDLLLSYYKRTGRTVVAHDQLMRHYPDFPFSHRDCDVRIQEMKAMGLIKTSIRLSWDNEEELRMLARLLYNGYTRNEIAKALNEAFYHGLKVRTASSLEKGVPIAFAKGMDPTMENCTMDAEEEKG